LQAYADNMDSNLLCTPSDPSFPPDKLPFVPWKERWDGGPFQTFAHRKNLVERVPLELRAVPSEKPFFLISEPYSPEEQAAFYQTWLFFGLLAEFYSLNQLSDGSRLYTGDVARKLDDLYQCYLDKERKHIDSSGFFKPEVTETLIQNLVEVEQAERVRYLRECLAFTFEMVKHPLVHITSRVTTSICALAEYFQVHLSNLAQLGLLKADIGLIFPWGGKYLEAGGSVEEQMMKAGWCRSQIEQTRYLFSNVNTLSFISRLKVSHPPRNHQNCSNQSCNTAQINMDTFKLSHVKDNCQCSVFEVDIFKIQEILRTKPPTYPVLRIQKYADLDQMTISVEPYNDGIPYVAISHVSFF
jgi:hypothetical protein